MSPRVGRALALAGMALTSYSLISNGGQAGVLTAIGCAGLGIGIGHLVRRRKR